MNWYKLMDIKDLNKNDLVSKSYFYSLEDIGEREIILFKGNYHSIVFEGIFLSYNMNNKTKFEFENHAITIIDDYVWLGVPIED